MPIWINMEKTGKTFQCPNCKKNNHKWHQVDYSKGGAFLRTKGLYIAYCNESRSTVFNK